MNKRIEIPSGEIRLMSREGLCKYLSMGETAADQFAESVGAKRKFGKSARYDKRVIDAALDALDANSKI